MAAIIFKATRFSHFFFLGAMGSNAIEMFEVISSFDRKLIRYFNEIEIIFLQNKDIFLMLANKTILFSHFLQNSPKFKNLIGIVT